MSAYDNALFLWHDATGNLMGILEIHIDDFVFYENDLLQKNVIADLKKKIQTLNTWKGNISIFGIRCSANKRWDYYQ